MGLFFESAVYAARPFALPPDFAAPVKNADLAAEKDALRGRFRAARQALTEEEYASYSAAACGRIAALPEVTSAATVHLYWPIPSRRELDTRPLVRQLDARGQRVVLPVVAAFEGAPRLRHVVFAGKERMRPNRWGILEPYGTSEVDPSALDAIVVPAFGAGRNGHRIGHGHGFYDAFLATVAAPTIGAVFDACLLDRVPAEPHDVPLDVIVTEREVWRR